MKHKIIFTLAALLLTPDLGHAQESRARNWGGPGFNLRQKSESKEAKRWTLQEWLDMKDRNYMMDLWLGMYAPSPYEFYLSGIYENDDSTTTTNTSGASTNAAKSARSYSGGVGAYAYLMGLQGDYQNNTEEGFNDLSGSLNLRVLGNAVQGTHLILGYGLRTRNSTTAVEPLRQQFAQADLDLYVMKAFGLHGLYRGFIPTSDAHLGDMSGSQAEAGAFLDFGPLRVFGQWFAENQSFDKNGGLTKTERTGVQGGLKLFF